MVSENLGIGNTTEAYPENALCEVVNKRTIP